MNFIHWSSYMTLTMTAYIHNVQKVHDVSNIVLDVWNVQNTQNITKVHNVQYVMCIWAKSIWLLKDLKRCHKCERALYLCQCFLPSNVFQHWNPLRQIVINLAAALGAAKLFVPKEAKGRSAVFVKRIARYFCTPPMIGSRLDCDN